MLELSQLVEHQIDSPSSSNGGSHSSFNGGSNGSTGGISLNNHTNMNGFGVQLNGMQSPLLGNNVHHYHHSVLMNNDGRKDQHKKTLLQQQHDDRVKRPMKFVNLKKKI